MTNSNYFELRQINSSTYDEFKVPVYLLDILSNPSSKILDFGCGFGQLCLALKEKGYMNIEGADINPMAIKALYEKNIPAHDLLEEKDFFDLNAGKFNYVIMSHVLEHIPKDQVIGMLTSVRRLLAGNGSLIIMVPNAQSNTGCYWAYEDFTHHTLFTSGSLYFVLQASGFSDIKFLDIDCLTGRGVVSKIIRKLLLNLYRINFKFWNSITASYFHKASPIIFSYEIKVQAHTSELNS
jgi:SAM-dependent methyltransferase